MPPAYASAPMPPAYASAPLPPAYAVALPTPMPAPYGYAVPPAPQGYGQQIYMAPPVQVQPPQAHAPYYQYPSQIPYATRTI